MKMLTVMKRMKPGKRFSLLSKGDSMRPLFTAGDLVYYRKLPYRKLKEDDIVLVEKASRLFTHRVIYKTPRYLVTKGDNNPATDGRIYAKDIIAKATHLKRGSKAVPINAVYKVQSMLYFHEITRVIKALEKKSIPVLILKGLPLHLYYEGKRPERIFADCDILIRHADAVRAATVFRALGYTKSMMDISPVHQRLKDKPTEDSYMKHIGIFPVVFDVHYEVTFMMTQLGKLEAIYPQRLIDDLTDDFFKHSRTITLQGSRFVFLAGYHQVLYLLMHYFHHNYQGVFRLRFIHNVIRKLHRQKQLYRDLASAIRSYKLTGYVFPAFSLLTTYYKTRLPASFLKEIAPETKRLNSIKNLLPNISVFDEKFRLAGGVQRFLLIYNLSPSPAFQKLKVFLQPAVIYSILWVLWKRITLGLKHS